jgi:ABC-2 type transport system permease protein
MTPSRTLDATKRGIPFTATLASEWTKLVTIRSTWITLALSLVVSTGITALVSWATGWSWSDWSASDQAGFDPILNSLAGSMFGAILFVVLGVNLVASEYASGMIRQTMTVTPRRGRVLLAKVLVVSVVAMVAGVIVNVATFLAGQAVFAAYDVPTASLSDGDAFRSVVLGMAVTSPVLPILGIAMAFLFRSAAIAITVVLAMIFMPSFFGPLIPQRWQEDVLAFLPGNASNSIATGNLDDSPMYLDPWLAAIVLAVWMVVFIGGTNIVLNRRDV